MRLQKKIGLKGRLFGLVVLAVILVMAIIGTGVFYFSHIEDANRIKEDVNQIAQNIQETRMQEKIYLQFFTGQAKKQFNEASLVVEKELEKLRGKKIDHIWQNQITACSSQFQEYCRLFEEFVTIHQQHNLLKQKMTKPLLDSDQLLNGIIKTLDAKHAELQMEGQELARDEAEMLNVARDCKIIFLQLQTIQQQYLISGEEKFIKEFHNLTSKSVNSKLTALTQFAAALKDKSFIQAAGTVEVSLKKFLSYIEQSQDYFRNEEKWTRALNDSGKKIIAAIGAFLAEVEKFIGGKRKTAFATISFIVIIGIFSFLLLSLVFVNSISKFIANIVQRLSQGAQNVFSSSGQTSSASKELAVGASEQAASLEQTSASIEELTAMTQSNVVNTRQADVLMMEANEIVGKTNLSMNDLTAAMKDITFTSDEMAKIIKTINEIAFQTNLLALNAAVEAARAGEAGSGFAVVAEEVRALAMRSAEAANNTANLIEANLTKVRDGSELLAKTAAALSEVTVSSSKVQQIVAEISEASQEQHQGLEQIRRAVTEMDRVVQKNAANAEESASASQELNFQADQLKAIVTELLSLVSRAKGKADKGSKPKRSHSRLLGRWGKHKEPVVPGKPLELALEPQYLPPKPDYANKEGETYLQ